MFTPTEAAAVAVVYALVVPPIFYREPALRELPQIFADSARLSGVIGLIIGFVGAFGWVLTYSKFPFVVAAAIAAIAPEWWLFMLLVIVLYIMLGTFLTPSEIILVTVPVLLPVAQAVGVHPIHFGMVCVIASAVGHITPPVGPMPVRRHGDQRPADGKAGEAAAAVPRSDHRGTADGGLHPGDRAVSAALARIYAVEELATTPPPLPFPPR